MVAIELKIGEFKAAYKGQMELYLRWLEKYETEASEEQPIISRNNKQRLLRSKERANGWNMLLHQRNHLSVRIVAASNPFESLIS